MARTKQKIETGERFRIQHLAYPMAMIIAVIYMFLFKDINRSISSSSIYIIVNCILMVAAISLFLLFFARHIVGLFKREGFLLGGYALTLLPVFVFSAYFVFIKMSRHMTGRFILLGLIMGDIFNENLFGILRGDPRTYSMVVYSLIDIFPFVRMTPTLVWSLNLVLSFLLIPLVFITARKVLKNSWTSFLATLAFVSFFDILWHIASIEYGLISLFFSTLSIYFLLDFGENGKKELFIISCLCLIIASYYRYELSLVFGLVYLAYYGFFIARHKKTRGYMSATGAVIIFVMMAFIKRFTTIKDIILTGDKLSGSSLRSYILNSVNIFKNNLIDNKDIALSSGRVSIFLYTGIIISVILLFVLIYRIIKKQDISQHKALYIFAFYILLFFFFQAGFHMEGFRSPKYHPNYFLGEVIITFWGIGWLVGRFKKLDINTKEEITLGLVIVFVILAFMSSRAMTFKMSEPDDTRVSDMVRLQENVEFDYKCKIIKISTGQPLLDYYFGAQDNALYLVNTYSPNQMYEQLTAYDKDGKCFYFLQEGYSDFEYMYEGIWAVDIVDMDKIFGQCNKSMVYEDNGDGSNHNRPIALIRYGC